MSCAEPDNLLEALENEIAQGSAGSAGRACRYLDTAQSNGLLPQVEEYRTKDQGYTLLHLAALFQHGESGARLLQNLASLCPRLLAVERDGQYQGQTALHIVVSKGNLSGVSALLSSCRDQTQKRALLEIKASGTKFKRTVMEGQLALHVAALTLNKSMVDILLHHEARLDAVNSLGDTVLHALVRFAGHHPDKTDSVVEIMDHLHAMSCKRIRRSPQDVKGSLIELNLSEFVGNQLSVWFVENNSGLTALKLAAAVGAGRVCAHILSLDGVYRLLDTHDGLFDTHLYDITELDPVCNKVWQQQRHETKSFDHKNYPTSAQKKHMQLSRSTVAPLDNYTSWGANGLQELQRSCFWACVPSCSTLTKSNSQSVLEIMCGVGASQAFCLISTDVVRQIVKSKWHRLRGLYYIWMLAHFLFMVGLIFFAIYRPRIRHEDIYSNASQALNGSTNSLSLSQKNFVKAWPWISTVLSVTYLGLECVRTIVQRQAWHLRRLYHNGLYRLLLVFFSVCLITDSLWYWFHEHNADSNFLLILSLLLGGWFAAFFLRAWRKFSFFTILFQKVLVGDMFRFSIMILLELVAFSAAMYVAYLPTSSPHELPEEFEDIWTSILTMFRLMLGLSDIEILSHAPAPWVAIGLYIAFILLTYVLLLNSLIAMMSQTCALVAEDRDLQWHMQRLSVLLMLETLLPLTCRPLMGQKKSCRRYSLRTGLPHQVDRFLKPVTSVQASYTDGKAILRRKNLVRTMGFGELTMKMVPAHFNTFSTSKPGQQTKDIMLLQGTSSFPEQFNFNRHIMENDTLTKEEAGEVAGYVYLDQTKTLNPNPESNEKNGSLAKACTPEVSNILAVSDENITVIRAPTSARRRHNSERRNRKTQTESNEHLSRSYPDGKLRDQHQDPAVTQIDNAFQPVVHYLAAPGGPILPHPSHLLGMQIGHIRSTDNLMSRQVFHSYPQHVQSNNVQVKANQERVLPHAYSNFDMRVQANPIIPGLSLDVPASGSIPGPVYSSHGPVQSSLMDTSPRVQFVDMNDLSTEA